MQTKKCLAIIDNKECGMPLELESPENEETISQYRCSLGHRTHIVQDKAPNNLPGGKIRDRTKAD
jgi:hypothetical protein